MNFFLKKFLSARIGQNLVGWVFSKASFMIPIKKLRETENWMAFVHPEPCYPVHIVVAPKRAISDWMSLPVDDPQLYGEFVTLTQSMIRDFCLQDAGFRLICNGGVNQTFPIFHVHLVAGEPFSAES